MWVLCMFGGFVAVYLRESKKFIFCKDLIRIVGFIKGGIKARFPLILRER